MRMIVALWDVVVVSGAVIAIIVIALGFMIRMIAPPSALKGIGTSLACMVVLVMAPSITVHLWEALSLWQQLGIAALIGIAVAISWERHDVRAQKQKSGH